MQEIGQDLDDLVQKARSKGLLCKVGVGAYAIGLMLYFVGRVAFHHFVVKRFRNKR